MAEVLDVVDDRGVRVVLEAVPRRIVSLVPSTTETLFDLGLGDRVVGVTRFCVHPAQAVAALPKVGGTKDLELERLAALAPDLVIGNAEENTREMYAEIEGRWPLYVAFPGDVPEAVADLRRMGGLLGAPKEAEALARDIEAAQAALRAAVRTRKRVAYLIWRKPWMAVSDDTFISRFLGEAGLDNAFPGRRPRYFELEPQELAGSEVDEVWLSSEPFPFKDTHLEELVAAGVPRERLRFADGELCSWHGSRMAAGLRWLAEAVGESTAEAAITAG